MYTGCIGAIVLFILGLVVLTTGIVTGAGVEVLVLGGLLTLSGVLAFGVKYINNKRGKDE